MLYAPLKGIKTKHKSRKLCLLQQLRCYSSQHIMQLNKTSVSFFFFKNSSALFWKKQHLPFFTSLLSWSLTVTREEAFITNRCQPVEIVKIFRAYLAHLLGSIWYLQARYGRELNRINTIIHIYATKHNQYAHKKSGRPFGSLWPRCFWLTLHT